ncbi:hypothetical protein DICPUDRAFT_81090 [Dictyostelium purpureum]|uniref:Uncharacterized protein n=1 Tax=Dictyostelium purpureum TaxID=5786 RepID=F0ZSG2_DICPU|nr:uncharacterized protein DICPUDRAFT_81090 [Dictyostelium purpureum]EGC33124.1 hypothetical protein DICPUDRAFT_81090 [Dictyostelium purpureum]|eukprot:XP_003290361.1 hypothetical protein DICPUDRAFT_81090 [Dictyostelium purpureum]
MISINQLNQLNKLNKIIIIRNYSILSKKNITNSVRKNEENDYVKTKPNTHINHFNNNAITSPPKPKKQLFSSIQFKLDENDEPYEVPENSRVITTDDILIDPRSSLEYLFRADEDQDQDGEAETTPMNMAEEYICRLLIEETKKDAAEDEFFFQQITALPEWNDYNDHILREVKKLELEEFYNPLPENKRLTNYYEKERIKRVNEIRKIHLIPVREAINRRYKELEKELDLVIEKKILVTMKNTKLTREQLKEHKDFKYLFDENYDPKHEIFTDKDDLDIILEEINGPLDSVPSVIKSIVQASKENFEKDMKFRNQRLLLEASQNNDNFNDYEAEELLIKNKPQQQAQQHQQKYQINDTKIETTTPPQQEKPKLSFSDIINDKSIKSNNKNNYLNNEEVFDLKSILNSMGKKV